MNVPDHTIEHPPETSATQLLSFGFKYGLPTEVNHVIDLRFLPNPYWVEDLRPLSGLTPEVASYVLHSEAGQNFFAHVVPWLLFLIEQQRQAEKPPLRIAFGCTGGRHRSVAVVESLIRELAGRGLMVTCWHRDLGKE